MSIGRRGSAGSGGWRFISSPSAMPTRSAPSSLALRLTSSAVRGWRKMPTMLGHSPIPLLFCTLRRGRCRGLLLHAFGLLQLPRHDPFVTFRADPANVQDGKSAASLAAFSCRLHFLGERDLLRCLLRDELLWPGEVRVIVVADWTDRQASRAITEGADYAQQPLPEAEEIPRSRHCDEIFRRRTLRLRIHGAPEKFQDLGEAELLCVLGAAALVDTEMQHRIARTGMQTAAARLADAHLLGHRPIGVKLELSEHAGEVETRPIFGRENIDLQAKRAETRFHPEVTRREPAVTCALVAPLGFLPRHYECWMPRCFKFLRDPECDLVHFPEHQHVHVLDRNIRFAAECAGRNVLDENDDALDVGGDPLGRLRPQRVWRERIEDRRIRNPDEIRAKRSGARLDHLGGNVCTALKWRGARAVADAAPALAGTLGLRTRRRRHRCNLRVSAAAGPGAGKQRRQRD